MRVKKWIFCVFKRPDRKGTRLIDPVVLSQCGWKEEQSRSDPEGSGS